MRLLEIVREALWPRRVICLCCGRPAHGGDLCEACEAALAALRVPGPVCRACGHPLEEGRCAFCDGKGNVTLRSAWVYRDEARHLVHALKFSGVAEAAQVLAEGMADAARALALPPETVITWPTMPAARRRERGIDHGALLARAVGERLGLPARQLLARSERIARDTQAESSRAERLTRLDGAFSCPEPVRGPVLLVDDVTTTGATAMTCAACLLEAGASSVTVVTAAQTPRKENQNGRDVRGYAVEKGADVADIRAGGGQRGADG